MWCACGWQKRLNIMSSSRYTLGILSEDVDQKYNKVDCRANETALLILNYTFEVLPSFESGPQIANAIWSAK